MPTHAPRHTCQHAAATHSALPAHNTRARRPPTMSGNANNRGDGRAGVRRNREVSANSVAHAGAAMHIAHPYINRRHAWSRRAHRRRQQPPHVSASAMGTPLPPTTTVAAAPSPTPEATGRSSVGSTATSPAPPTRSSNGLPANGASTKTSPAPRSSRSPTGTSPSTATTANHGASARSVCPTTRKHSSIR